MYIESPHNPNATYTYRGKSICVYFVFYGTETFLERFFVFLKGEIPGLNSHFDQTQTLKYAHCLLL